MIHYPLSTRVTADELLPWMEHSGVNVSDSLIRSEAEEVAAAVRAADPLTYNYQEQRIWLGERPTVFGSLSRADESASGSYATSRIARWYWAAVCWSLLAIWMFGWLIVQRRAIRPFKTRPAKGTK